MTEILIVAHQPSGNTKALAQALVDGAKVEGAKCAENDGNGNGLNVVCQTPFATNANDVTRCDGIVLFTTENFGYMSGAQKDFFERVYYEVINTKRGLPYALVIRAGQDGTGALRSTESIIKGLGWKLALEPVIFQGAFNPKFIEQAREFSETFATGLTCGIF